MEDIYIHLSKDPVLSSLLKIHAIEELQLSEAILSDILDSIVSQQLSTKAGATIWKRFIALFPAETFPEPIAIVAMPDETMRACGISYGKIRYMKGVCQAIIDGSFDPKSLYTMQDEEVISCLTELKGIGRWTAEMILISTLKRPDVFSLGDLGLRTAVSKLYGIPRDNLKKIEQISKAWSPYRSYASKLLWKSLDNTPIL